MTRRVYLHIGTPKSGTTYLQDRLATNREVVARQGLSYLNTRTGDHFEAALDLIQERWAGQLDVARGQWAALAHEAKRAPRDVLISHEILSAATPPQVEQAMAEFAHDEVHLVLTARDLARQIPAEWQERIKHRGRRSFSRFARDLVQDNRRNPANWFWRVQSIPDILTRWGNGLPPDRIHVVTVPQADAPKDELWRRFAGVVGLDLSASYAESTSYNVSLGVVEANVLRRLNKLLAGHGIPREVYVELVRELLGRDVLAARPNRIPAVLPRNRWAFTEEVTAEWREWLEGSGVDVVGDLDDLRPVRPGPEHVWIHPDRPPADLVAEASLESLAAVIADSAQTRRWTMRKLARRLRRS